MTYGCKIMVSLTLCRFLDHPVHNIQCIAVSYIWSFPKQRRSLLSLVHWCRRLFSVSYSGDTNDAVLSTCVNSSCYLPGL